MFQKRERKKNRVKILTVLRKKRGFNEIFAKTDIGSKSTISSHLEELLENNLIKKDKKYSITDKGKKAYRHLRNEINTKECPKKIGYNNGKVAGTSITTESVVKGEASEEVSIEGKKSGELNVTIPKDVLNKPGTVVVSWIPE